MSDDKKYDYDGGVTGITVVPTEHHGPERGIMDPKYDTKVDVNTGLCEPCGP